MRAHIFWSYTAASAALGLGCQLVHATEITVVASHGSVSVTQRDHLVPVSASTRLTLPAQIKTGSDGALDLKDNDSLIHIGPNSTVALPDTGPSGSLVDRYLQSAGSALYNIQSRHGRPMSVETPYLVSVVKGTVFTIAVEDGATSVTLLEGTLDVSAPDVRQHVLLKANQSIRHHHGESSLTAKPIGAAPERINSTAKARPLPDEVDSTEVALVTRDLAEVGAAVSAQHAALSASVAHGFAGSSGIPNASRNVGPPGTTIGGTTSSDTDAPGSITSGSNSNNSGPSSPGSSPTGTTSGPAGDSSSGSSGNSGPSGNSGSSGNSKSGSSGNDDDSVIPKVGCNGKTNGTGQGRCLGHGKNKS
jgi:hypothetical protein